MHDGGFFAIYKIGTAFTAIMTLDPAANGAVLFELVPAIELHIIYQQQAVVVNNYGIVHILYYDTAIHTTLHLFCFIVMGVIPESTCIRQLKPVLESFAGLNRPLHIISAIHGCRKPDAMPVNNGWFRKVVLYFYYQRIALVCFEHRPR